MRTSVTIIPGKTDEALANASRMTPMRLATAVRLIAEIGKGQIQARAPRGWSNALAGSYDTEVRGVGTAHPRGFITNPVLYHDVQEEGRRPGKRPPVAPLIPWVGSKLGIPPGPQREAVAFLVARKIGRYGYEGEHMVKEGMDATITMLRPVMWKMGLAIIKDIRA